MQKIRLIVAASAAFLLAVALLTGADAQTKRIKDLPAATSTVTGDIVPIDGTTLRGITVENFLKPSLVAIKALTPAADQCVVFTSGTAAALAACPTYGRSLLATASAAAARTALGSVIGTDVQAFNARLADIAGATYAQGNILYYNGTNLVVLAPGTSGHFLKSQGAGANLVYAAVPGGGDMLIANNLSELTATASTARTNIGVPLADAAAMEAQTAGRVVTADVQQRHPSSPKFWIHCTASGTSMTRQAAYNSASTVGPATDACGRTGVGVGTLTFTTNFSGNFYACVGTIHNSGGSTMSFNTMLAAQVSYDNRNSASSNVDIGFSVVCFGDQ